MTDTQVKIWYDPEGDYLEVIFDQREGYFCETEDDRVVLDPVPCFWMRRRRW